jgi:hypothetical protein
MAFNESLQKLWRRPRESSLSIMIVSLKKIMNEATYFSFGKTQGIFNGGKGCRSMVGCNARYCLER